MGPLNVCLERKHIKTNILSAFLWGAVSARDGGPSVSNLHAAERADGAPEQLSTEDSAGRAASPGPEGEAPGFGDGAVISGRAAGGAHAQQTACE